MNLNPFALFLGPSPDMQISDKLLQLADVVTSCTGFAHRTKCGSLQPIVDFEHQGDVLKREVFKLLGGSFIFTRLSKSDVRRFTRDLDNIINGIRAVAGHIEIWQEHIGPLPGDALSLLEIIDAMSRDVRILVEMLVGGTVDMVRVEELTSALDAAETEADIIRFNAEKQLASGGGADTLRILALIKLYGILESVTDHANHCGVEFVHIAERRG